MKKQSTIRSKIWEIFDAPGGDKLTCTATYISKKTGVRLDSLSSVLNKMCKQGFLCRVKGIGPRGGYGYYKPEKYCFC